jgi:hypothetical protein
MFILILAAGCQTISRQQRATVNRFAEKTAEFSATPAAMLEELSSIRESRGIYYASSFSDPVLHLAELDHIIREKAMDEKWSGKAGTAFRVLENYAEGLKQLSDNKPLQKTEDHFASFGKDLKKLISIYNEEAGVDKVPEGIGKLFTQSAEVTANAFLAKRQARALRECVVKADTLVSALCTEMAGVLRSEGIDRLIDAEATGLQESFRFYFSRIGPSATGPDREYISLMKRINSVRLMREKLVKATLQLRMAHKKLAEEVTSKRKAKELADELMDYYREADEIHKLIRNL